MNESNGLDRFTDAELLAKARIPRLRSVMEGLLADTDQTRVKMAQVRDDAARAVEENVTTIARLRRALEATAVRREV